MSIALQNSTSNNASRHHHNIHNLLTNLPSLLLKLITCALINHSFVHLICLLLSLLPHQILIGNKKASTLYTCAAYNHELKEYKFSDNAFNFNITRRHDRNLHTVPPEQQWVNQSSPIALLGHVHKLHCFFSGL
uniref:Ig-like domain-containing protein n=1 Tax=Globodera rostochiensis TaxID=31243 RepID=A0A914H9M7_GLORO